MAEFKFYRIHLKANGGISLGYEYTTTEPLASKLAKDWRREEPDRSATVEEITVQATKKGFAAALNMYAGHPDNG